MPAKGIKTNKPAYNRLNLVGKRFTRLTVISDIGNHPTTGESYWECKCDCGKTTKVTGYCLTSGNTKSCGCYHKIRTHQLFSLPPQELGLNRVCISYRKWAKEKGNCFKLTKEQVKNLIESDCYYCGEKPSNDIGLHRGIRFIYQGIDRLDNTKGYTPDNVVPCCIVCNKMKKALSHDEFLLHIHRIASRFEAESSQVDFYSEVCGGQVLC